MLHNTNKLNTTLIVESVELAPNEAALTDPKTIEMFQVLVCGSELVKAYSELVDPIIQREAFEEQARNRANGDEESFGVDEDFLLAMEHGMPPISGLGFGIDRLVALLTDQQTLRDTIFFPLVK
jgi:lysyl-tRNA synthetase class 2